MGPLNNRCWHCYLSLIDRCFFQLNPRIDVEVRRRTPSGRRGSLRVSTGKAKTANMRQVGLALIIIGAAVSPTEGVAQASDSDTTPSIRSHFEVQLMGAPVGSGVFPGAALQWTISGRWFEVPLARVGMLWVGSEEARIGFWPTVSIGVNLGSRGGIYVGGGVEKLYDGNAPVVDLLSFRLGTTHPAIGERLELNLRFRNHSLTLPVITWTIPGVWSER